MDSSVPSTQSLRKDFVDQSQSASNKELVNVNEAVSSQRRPLTRRKAFWIILVLAFIVVVLVVVLPVVFLVAKKNNGGSPNTSSGSDHGSGGSAAPLPTGGVTLKTGGDGSTVTTDNGTTFVYQNQFGGYWVQDSANPFNNDARPNSWTPPLNSSWRWGVDRIYGVNLGGLFVLEPFITPELFQRYPNTVDEYTLSQAMAADQANGGLGQLEQHYATFITEEDIAQIAGAGLNFIRIPIAFWAIETWSNEPYFARTSWKYFLRVLDWARKYGLRVCVDFHAAPGSQNGYNHSGKMSSVNFLASNMGLASAERTLYYIRIFTEFLSQPEYSNLVVAFGILNEPLLGTIGQETLTSFYLRAYDTVRSVTGLGEGNGPYIVFGDGFQLGQWSGALQGGDRMILDQHPYFAFGNAGDDPITGAAADGLPGGEWPLRACNAWGPPANQSRRNFGLYFAGELAASPNDCGLFLNGVGNGPSSSQCAEYDAWESYNPAMKQGIENFVLATFDAVQDWFFWTWKIGPSQAGRVETPLWSYQLGLQNGWIPQDPRVASGKCVALGAAQDLFDGNYKPWQTGTPSSIPASSTQAFPWPPAAITSADVPVSLLPTYTNTAPIITLPPQTYTSAPSQVTVSVDGWFDASDTQLGITTIEGCPYPDEYTPTFSVVPTAPCTGPDSAPAAVTPPPAVVTPTPAVATPPA
ncbi:hypothetical protein D9756_001169 [Leucocoprinus leucothites]|uniref:glucan 1,3-beta-glucosidase n=1 Tax=Leucocoprinus leucothites TaxID=201217 RepID=A0A8H5G4D3_9AGAR|nr:hypothetical protein D9756_001169 [Leucoagaricus leucothites]